MNGVSPNIWQSQVRETNSDLKPQVVGNTPDQKLHTKEETAQAQKTKPSILNSDAAKFAQKACGFTLISLGVAGILVLSPITIPMGLLGRDVGKAIGKAFGHEKTGMFIGEAVGTLLFSGLAIAGAKLIDNASKSKDGKIKENEVLETHPLTSADKEKEIKRLESSIAFNEQKYKTMKSVIEHGLKGEDLEQARAKDLLPLEKKLAENRAKLKALL